LDLGEAAEALGVTREAVRRRAKRGTLESERGDDGRLYVWVHDDHHAGDDRHDVRHHDPDELVEELRDRVRYLEEESRRKDHLLAAALERIPPALEEAPPEPRESPSPAGVAPDTPEPRSAAEGQQEPTSRPEERSWWRRMFGG
jgi:hypothetical protein